MKKVFKYLLFIILGLFSFVFLYFLSAFGLGKIAVSEETCENKYITCYIKSNGVHTDIVVPIESESINWNNYFSPENTKSKSDTWKWVGIGWGDKGFYLETPTWADLKAKTAFNAAFGLSSSALHLTYYSKITEGEKCYSFQLCEDKYQELIQYILKSTVMNDKQVVWINTNAVYGTNDAFYEAKGKYSLFQTCNTWSNTALKTCGAKAAFWTPFESGILQHYKTSD